MPTAPLRSPASDATTQGRFVSGAVIAERYRIVGLLGRGGMGEIYRADDLKLGQPVALKFLPAAVEFDPGLLARFHNEVRVARQVSHKNVCRVYDIGEVDGHHFLSMEYIDGEDLASLLRRIGRLPADKAVEVARQLCAGLAAAHERGVLHRDLKPANVMIDGQGKVRIADFGLAAVSGEVTGADVRSGTPAYMAPEQLAGRVVSVRSDIYSLGLVLYEMFTGRRAFEAPTIGDLMRLHEQADPPSLSSAVRDLDPAIERVVLRCLDRMPEARPPSALAVSAALPGGDPLAAALAAGETPSPEMVAAAGQTNAVTLQAGLAAVAFVVLGLGLIAATSDRLAIFRLVPFDKPPVVLADRATQIARSLGYTTRPVDTMSGLYEDSDLIEYIAQSRRDRQRWAGLSSGRPSALLFWMRTSNQPLVPLGGDWIGSTNDPPFTMSGMTTAYVDTEGRLVRFDAIPPQVDPSTPSSIEPDWRAAFQLAGLDFAAFAEAASEWRPISDGDVRRAWTGTLPEGGEAVRVEAAGSRGKIIYFHVIGPWTRAARMRPAENARLGLGATLAILLVPCTMAGAIVMARRNLRQGRGDRRGAFRAAVFVLVGHFATWVLTARHFPDLGVEWERFSVAAGQVLFVSGMMWLAYLALEPYVRRYWSNSLIGWTRVLAGRIDDPLVGRDILAGACLGTTMVLLLRAHDLAVPMLGYPPPPPVSPPLEPLLGIRYLAGGFLARAADAVANAMIAVLVVVLFRSYGKRRWIGLSLGILLFAVVISRNMAGDPVWVDLVFSIAVAAAIPIAFFRFGLLAAAVAFFFTFVLTSLPTTLSFSEWYSPIAMWVFGVATALTFYGFHLSRAGQPLFGPSGPRDES